jgi:hypothetical protein
MYAANTLAGKPKSSSAHIVHPIFLLEQLEIPLRCWLIPLLLVCFFTLSFDLRTLLSIKTFFLDTYLFLIFVGILV